MASTTSASASPDRAGGRSRGSAVTGAVTAIDPVARRMLRIRIEGDGVRGLAWMPGQHVRVHVAGMRDPRNWLRPFDMLRTYSVWNYDDGALELCVLDHGEAGPGTRWARGLSVGAEVMVSRPQGSFVLRDEAYHVFAGEETAAVAFGPMLRALPASASAYAVIEVDEPADRLPLDRDVHWLYRQGAPAASSATLVKGLASLDLPAHPGVAYLAGEARTIQLLRQHLVTDRGWPRRSVLTKPFWTPGRRGLD
jgi:NADPH-dependent ferric siderophore reductase